MPGEGGQVPGGGEQALPGGQGDGGRPLLQQVPVLLPPPRARGVSQGHGQGPGQSQGGSVRRPGTPFLDSLREWSCRLIFHSTYNHMKYCFL